MNILIIGVNGGLAQLTVKIIQRTYPQAKIIGIDSRPIDNIQTNNNFIVYKMKYSRGNFEKIFREHKFDYVYHLARFSHVSNRQQELVKRLELSVMGTSRILELSLRFDVKKVIVLSTFHVYGALASNSIFLNEDAPLKASLAYPELTDVVEMDQISTNWMWKYQDKIQTVVLRPCNIIGPQINNAITQFLNSPITLKPIDYNPVFQFIHEFDMAQILLKSIDKLPSGIYNVATDDFISLRDALKITGGNDIPFPISIAGVLNKALKYANLDVPDYLIDYLKYSCLLDNSHIKEYLGENFYRFQTTKALKIIKN